jgi:hypothetical protein
LAIRESTLSELLQHSGRVLSDVEEGEILRHRRDGEDPVLMTRRQSDALRTTFEAFLARSIGSAAAMNPVLPWLTYVSPHDRDACIGELREVGAASLQTSLLSRLAETLYAWEARELAAWDERRNRERSGHLSDAPVDLPRASR